MKTTERGKKTRDQSFRRQSASNKMHKKLSGWYRIARSRHLLALARHRTVCFKSTETETVRKLTTDIGTSIANPANTALSTKHLMFLSNKPIAASR